MKPCTNCSSTAGRELGPLDKLGPTLDFELTDPGTAAAVSAELAAAGYTVSFTPHGNDRFVFHATSHARVPWRPVDGNWQPEPPDITPLLNHP